MTGINCWEFKKCGREPNGKNADKLGVCPVATNSELDGINGGKAGGRCCWSVCEETDSPVVYPPKLSGCTGCGFFKLVAQEEKMNFKTTKDVLRKLRPKMRYLHSQSRKFFK